MRFRFGVCVFSVLLSVVLVAQAGSADPAMQALKEELDRSYTVQQPTPPYFISYQLSDYHTINVESSFGAVTSSRDRQGRSLDIDLRVGDYKLDNTHGGRGGGYARFGQASGQIPFAFTAACR